MAGGFLSGSTCVFSAPPRLRVSAVNLLFNPRRHHRPYSYRNATIGSTRVARRAGTEHASRATVPRRTLTAANVNGSLELTPYRSLDINRVSANAVSVPNPTPISTR